MKVRYDESFLFPQSREDFGRSLVFPQGNLHGLGAFGATGDTTLDALLSSKQYAQDQADSIARQVKILQAQLPNLENPNVFSIPQAINFLKQNNVYYDGMPAEVIAATAHALSPSVYVSGAGSGYGSAEVVAEQYQKVLKDLNDYNEQYAGLINEINSWQKQIDYRPTAIKIEQDAAAQMVILKQQQAAAQAAYEANQKAAAAAAAAAAAVVAPVVAPVVVAPAAPRFDIVAVDIAVNALKRAGVNTTGMSEAQLVDALNKLYPGQSFKISNYTAGAVAAVTTTNNTAGTVTTTNPATGTVTTTSPTTGATTTANVVTGAVTVTTPAGQTVSGTGSVTAGNTSTTVNQATGTVTTTNTTTGATTVTNAATGQSQTGTAAPTTYILDFYDNQFWLKTSAGAAVSNGSADFRTPTEYLSRSNITLAQTTLTPAASVKFANNQGVTTVVNSAGGTTTTNPTTGTVTTTNPATGTVTTTNTTTGTTTTTTPATGTTTTTTTPAIDTGKIALLALLGVLLLRGAVR
jgi:hypothetical protein